jgi:hypothetical protein
LSGKKKGEGPGGVTFGSYPDFALKVFYWSLESRVNEAGFQRKSRKIRDVPGLVAIVDGFYFEALSGPGMNGSRRIRWLTY